MTRASCIRGTLVLPILLLASCFDGDNPGLPTPTPTPTATPTPTPTPTSGPVTLTSDFAVDGAQWTAGFADYADEQADLIDFQSGVRQLPAPLQNETGYLLGGTNRSDDLAMFVWRRVENLDPAKSYAVAAQLTIASNTPDGCFGVGGSPGDSVYIKAGAAPSEPVVAKDEQGDYRVSVDKGQQAQSGSEAVVVGTMATPGAGTCTDGVYATKTIPAAEDLPVVTPDAQGNLWLFIATDSAFESRTEVYLLDASFTLTPQ